MLEGTCLLWAPRHYIETVRDHWNNQFVLTETRCDLRLLLMSTVDSSSLIGGDMVQSYSVDFGDIFAISALKIAQPAVPLLLDLPVVLASLPSCTDAQTLMQRSESFLLWDRGRNNIYNVTCNRCQASQEGRLSLEVV